MNNRENTALKKTLIALVAAALIGLLALPALAGDSAGQMLNDGAAALTAGDYDQAVDLLTKAIDSKALPYKDRPKAYHWRGRAYESKSYWGNALNDYRRAIWLDRSNNLYREDADRIKTRMGGSL